MPLKPEDFSALQSLPLSPTACVVDGVHRNSSGDGNVAYVEDAHAHAGRVLTLPTSPGPAKVVPLDSEHVGDLESDGVGMSGHGASVLVPGTASVAARGRGPGEVPQPLPPIGSGVGALPGFMSTTSSAAAVGQRGTGKRQ